MREYVHVFVWLRTARFDLHVPFLQLSTIFPYACACACSCACACAYAYACVRACVPASFNLTPHSSVFERGFKFFGVRMCVKLCRALSLSQTHTHTHTHHSAPAYKCTHTHTHTHIKNQLSPLPFHPPLPHTHRAPGGLDMFTSGSGVTLAALSKAFSEPVCRV